MEEITLLQALDHFIEHTEPGLFPDGRKGVKGYSTVRNILRARRMQKEGRAPDRPITDDWIEGILRRFGAGRYEIRKGETVVIVHPPK